MTVGAPVSAAPARHRLAPPTTAARMLALQRQAGNAAVAGLFVQRKEGCDCGGSCCTSDEDKVAVQRDADDTRIKGVFPGRGGIDNAVFFEFGSHDLDDKETNKLKVIAEADKKAKLVLRGFASEEGRKAVNQAIIKKRMATVSSLLWKFENRVKRTTESKLEKSRGNIDYRHQRRVEVVPLDEKETCVKGASPIVACGPEVPQAYERAKALLATALGKVAGPEFDPAVRAFYKTADPGIAALVIGQLNTLVDVVDKMSNLAAPAGSAVPDTTHHRCENLCADCRAKFPARGGPNPAPNALFCPEFVKGDSRLGVSVEEARAHIVIHESGHAIGLREMARVFERAFPFLRTQDALNNTDSLTGLVRELSTPGLTNGLAKPDTGARTAGTDKAMAFTERWAFLAHVEANHIYEKAAQIEGDPLGWVAFTPKDPKDPRLLTLMADYDAIAAEFPPMTPSPKAPTAQDRSRLAVVNDRFDRMADVLANPVEVVVGGPTVVWTRRAGGDLLTVPAGFDTLPLGDQCRAILRAVASRTDGISAEAVEKYVRLAPRLSDRRSPGLVPQ